MNKYITKHGSKLVALVAGFVLFSSAAEAQNLVVGATGNFNNQGTVRFRSNTGNFQNDAPIGNITNDGRIQILGNAQTFNGTNTLTSTSALRIPGLVEYARDTAASPQRIFNGYYDDVTVTGQSVKNFTHSSLAYFVGGDYTITSSGNRDYTGSTFTYDGGTGTTGAATQTVAAEESGVNGTGYANLAFGEDALKTLSGAATASGTTDVLASTSGSGVVVDGTAGGSLISTGNFTQAASAGDYTLSNGGLTTLNGAANTISALVSVDDGTLTLGSASTTTITGAGSQLNLATATANTSNLALAATATLNVDGTFANADLGRTNMTFDPTSTVEYQENALGGIITTASAAANRYGNLSVARTTPYSPNNSGGTENDLNIATNLNMNGSDLDMLSTTGGMVNMWDNAGTPATATYAGQEEVLGRFRRSHDFATSTAYTYGNSGTTVSFATAPSSGDFFEINMNRDGQTQQYDATRDIQRDINIDYTPAATFSSTIQVGYTQADRTDGTWPAAYTEDQIVYIESDETDIEYVGTGQTYAYNASTATTFGTVSLAGITNTSTDVDQATDAGFFPSNELILRAGPAIVASVQPGRWANPVTWDLGIEPRSFDSVLVRHNVWAGFVRTVDNFTGNESTPGQMAAAINIISPDAPGGFPTPTLMIGYSDTDMTSNFATSDPSSNGTGSVYTGALGGTAISLPPANGISDEMPTADVATDYVGGLIIFNDPSDTEVPELWVKGTLDNQGAINIGGILSIGQ